MNDKKKVIAEKGCYKLVVEKSTEDDNLCYKIINNYYGVVEAETRILPQAYKFLEEISAALDFQTELEEQDKVVDASKLN